MSETRWTPGPWMIDPTTLTICRLIFSTEDVECDAISGSSGTIAYVPTDYNTAEQHRNARLIAAAPELYEALADALGTFAAFNNLLKLGADPLLDRMLAALAKARGEA